MQKKQIVKIGLLLACGCCAANEHLLQLDYPGVKWEADYFPIGNGELGAMLNGGVRTEDIQLNVDSLWTGDDNLPSGNYDTMGSYQSLGNLKIDFTPSAKPRQYRRSLDLSQAIAATQIQSEDKQEQNRSAFVSAPDRVLVYRVSSSAPLSGVIRFTDSHNNLRYREAGVVKTVKTEYRDGEIRLDGILPNQLKTKKVIANPYKTVFDTAPSDLRYRVAARVTGDGKIDTTPEHIAFENCRTLTVYLAEDTTYTLSHARRFRDPAKLDTVAARVDQAAKRGYDELKQRHVADYRQYFDRVQINLGTGKPELPLQHRLQNVRQAGENDPGLAELLFQYGRYLLISSSRPGTLPANLQGIWNNSNTPAWNCDYHTNINIQMNYWGVDAANLSECHRPLFDLMREAIPVATRDTRNVGKNLDGFTFRTSMNIFGGPGWRWNWPSGAWLALHMYSHYQYTQDRQFLAETAWPFFDGTAQFWLSYLKKRPDGTYVVPNGWSPEHGPTEDGVAHDQQIVAEFLDAYLAIAAILGKSDDKTARAAAIRPKLLGNKIGKWGQLQEWETDRDKQGDEHRHTSHLFAVYPGNTIDAGTPEFYQAARIALAGRKVTGDSRRSWSWPWRAALWARLGDGAKASEMVQGLLRYNTNNNLFTTHPPFQIDGNLGILGAICEMLLQCDSQGIRLLPVDLPLWPEGSFSGLRAKGGYTVSAAWQQGRLVRAELTADRAGTLRVTTRTPMICRGQRGTRFEIPVKAGEKIELLP